MEKTVLVLDPFNNGSFPKTVGITYLEMHKVYGLLKSEADCNKSPIANKEIVGIVVDMRQLPNNLLKVERIRELLFAASSCKPLKHIEVVIAGEEQIVKENFVIKDDMRFAKDPWIGAEMLKGKKMETVFSGKMFYHHKSPVVLTTGDFFIDFIKYKSIYYNTLYIKNIY